MKKRIEFLFLIVFCYSFCLLGKIDVVKSFYQGREDLKTSFQFEEEIKVRLSFSNRTVTTRSLEQLLEKKGFLLSFKLKNTFPYLDDSMEKALDQIYSQDIASYEVLLEKKLENYGFFDESEKIKQFGAVLESVEVRIPKKIFLSLRKQSGVQMYLL